MRSILLLLLSCVMAVAVPILWPAIISAHGGGTPRLSGQQAGPYRVYAWSEPDPLREGETHLTVGVTIPSDNEVSSDADETPVTDAEVRVTYTPQGNVGEPVVVLAEPQNSLGVVYYEADAKLSASGPWHVQVAVSGSEGTGDASFVADAAPARQVRPTAIALVGAVVIAGLLTVAVRARKRDNSNRAPSKVPAGNG